MADEENTGRISPNAEATDAGLGREELPWPDAHIETLYVDTIVSDSLAGKMSVPTDVTELHETPTTGVIYARFADDEDDGHYYWNGTEWRQL